jgi:transcriptional regulator with XRE-family HTH domain
MSSVLDRRLRVVTAHDALLLAMDFPDRLAALRKQKGLTQQALADRVGVHVIQIRRYEGGKTQPTLEVIRNLAVALGVSADALLFEEGERGPDEELRLQFEALAAFRPEEKKVAKAVLESLILKHEADRWAKAGGEG